MKRLNIVLVAGARPNFMKVAPILRAFYAKGLKPRWVHTGQHYDFRMSRVFFRDLGMPKPDAYLGAGSGSHAEQTAAVMIAFEKCLLRWKPSMVVVVGDVNSTLAAALVASKLQIPVAHVEAGLRSRDETMPEEKNRMATDGLTHLFLTSESAGAANLRKEGVAASQIKFCGNVMIDSLVHARPKIKRSTILKKLRIQKPYGIVTLHRPSNVDHGEGLQKTVSRLNSIQKKIPLIFPVHPRTKASLERSGLLSALERSGRILMIEPQGYVDFMKLVGEASFVLTDSGGVQEETTFLGVPCLTLRANTERPVTVSLGTNELVWGSDSRLFGAVNRAALGRWKKGKIPPKWDGRAAERMTAKILQFLPPVVR